MSEERKIPTITFNKLNSFQQTLIKHSIIFKPQAKPYMVISKLNTMDKEAIQKHERSFSVSKEDSNSKTILTAITLTIATLSCYQAILAHKNITTSNSPHKSYHTLLKNLSDLLIELTLEISNIDKKSQIIIWEGVPTNLINLLSDLRIRTEIQLIEKRELNQKSDKIKAKEDFQSQLLAIVDTLQQRFIQVVLSINPNIEEKFFSSINDLLVTTDREISQNINFNKTLGPDALTKEFTQFLTKITSQAIKIRDSKNYFEPVSKTHEYKPETRTEEEIKQYGGLPDLTQLPMQSYQKMPTATLPSFQSIQQKLEGISSKTTPSQEHYGEMPSTLPDQVPLQPQGEYRDLPSLASLSLSLQNQRYNPLPNISSLSTKSVTTNKYTSLDITSSSTPQVQAIAPVMTQYRIAYSDPLKKERDKDTDPKVIHFTTKK